MKVKRFVVFSFDAYEAIGGVDDMVDSFDTIEEAKKCGEERVHGYKHPSRTDWICKDDWAQILDLETGEAWRYKKFDEWGEGDGGTWDVIVKEI